MHTPGPPMRPFIVLFVGSERQEDLTVPISAGCRSVHIVGALSGG